MTGPILYHGEPNGPSLSVLAALEESGLAIECRHIDLLKGERHTLPGLVERVAMDMAVEGEGPVLVVDGEAMSEAVFLAQHFDETAGGCGLQPKDPYARWQMLMWCRQVTERLSPAVAYLGVYGHAGGGLAAFELSGINSEDLRARWQDLRDGVIDEAKVADSEAKIDQFAARVENQLADGREWLMGGFSIADLETFAWLRPAALFKPAAFAGKPGLAAWLERMEARPSVRRALARAQTEDPRTSFAPGPEINRWG